MALRKLGIEYRSEIVFGAVLAICLVAGYWFGRYIPTDFYVQYLNLILNACIATLCLSGAVLLVFHTDGLRVRRQWIFTLVMYAVCAILLLCNVSSFMTNPNDSLMKLKVWEMVVGNFLAWLLLLYPTEVLRPGWMNPKRAFLQSVPVWTAVLIDRLFSIDLRILLAIYPLFLVAFVIVHISEYRKWCEENYSSMDDIDAQWMVRYIIMYFLYGFTFIVLCFSSTVATQITQQIFLIFLLAYSTEQILFRPDPWSAVHRHKRSKKGRILSEEDLLAQEEEQVMDEQTLLSIEENRQLLEEWMAREKPYLDPAFRLMDIRQILPMNRTSLSQFFKTAYGCSFYQYVIRYRIEEAKRLMTANPNMKLQDIAEQSGFSSPVVFSRTFSREEGLTPTEWRMSRLNQENKSSI